jgi:hypothetical protein
MQYRNTFVVSKKNKVLMDLTGIWKADDTGTYYIRHIGDSLWWLGMSGNDGRLFTNIFRGKVMGENIEGDWVDVPKGEIIGNGRIRLNAGRDAEGQFFLEKTFETGGFGGTYWYKVNE